MAFAMTELLAAAVFSRRLQAVAGECIGNGYAAMIWFFRQP